MWEEYEKCKGILRNDVDNGTLDEREYRVLLAFDLNTIMKYKCLKQFMERVEKEHGVIDHESVLQTLTKERLQDNSIYIRLRELLICKHIYKIVSVLGKGEWLDYLTSSIQRMI